MEIISLATFAAHELTLSVNISEADFEAAYERQTDMNDQQNKLRFITKWGELEVTGLKAIATVLGAILFVGTGGVLFLF